MPKPKKPIDKPSPLYRADEVSDFLNDLKKPPINDPVNGQPGAPGKKIRVIPESTGPQSSPPAPPPIDKVLKEDDQKKTGTMATMQRDTSRHFPWGWVIGGLTVLAIAAITGFFFFNRAQRFSGERVTLQLEIPASAASGDDLTLIVKYQNLETVDLTRAELTIEYPESFRVEETSQAATNNFQNVFNLGNLKSGRAGTLTVTGTIFGSVDTTRDFSATLNYRPANFSSEFQVTATATTTITSSILALELNGPDELSPDTSGTWTITYRNTSERDLDNVQVEAIYPEGLTVTATEPAASERNALWRIETVAKGSAGEIKITGLATGQIGDSLELIVRAGLLSTGNNTDLQAEEKLLVFLINSGTAVTIAVNGMTEDSVAEPGETLSYTLQLSNDGETELSDVQVALTLKGQAVDMATLKNPAAAAVSDRTLTWTKDQVLGLAAIKPQQEVTMRFSVDTVDLLTVENDADINPTVTAEAAVTSPDLPSLPENSSPTTMVTKIAAVFKFDAEARYYNDAGAALGAGPIPPVVGGTTSYRVYWRVTNTTSDASDLTLTTTLPSHVFWTGKNISRDAGDISFNAAKRTVTWTLNKVPASTGSRLPTLNAAFEVSITPTSSQIGADVVLSPSATATATDSWTGRSIEITEPTLTTDLPTDPEAAGEGVVQAS